MRKTLHEKKKEKENQQKPTESKVKSSDGVGGLFLVSKQLSKPENKPQTEERERERGEEKNNKRQPPL